MMSNTHPFEQFIQQNRAAFDTAEPHPVNWARVEQALDRLPGTGSLEQFIAFHRAEFDSAIPSDTVWKNIDRALDTTDPLERFIRENRGAFDTETPDLRVWAALESTIPVAEPKKEGKTVHVHWYRGWQRIAASIALLIAGIGIGIWYAQSSGQASSGMAMSDVSSEYAELEQYYQRDISAKQEKLATLVSNPDNELNNDLSQMDQIMAELRRELANVPVGSREKVIRAMIENYKAKTAILERVLQHLQQQQPATTNSGNYEVEKI